MAVVLREQPPCPPIQINEVVGSEAGVLVGVAYGTLCFASVRGTTCVLLADSMALSSAIRGSLANSITLAIFWPPRIVIVLSAEVKSPFSDVKLWEHYNTRSSHSSVGASVIRDH